MTTSIKILPSGNYEVSIYLVDCRGYGRWHGLRCFYSQGDARDFANNDVPKFTINELDQFIKTYSNTKPMVRFGFKRYRKL